MSVCLVLHVLQRPYALRQIYIRKIQFTLIHFKLDSSGRLGYITDSRKLLGDINFFYFLLLFSNSLHIAAIYIMCISCTYHIARRYEFDVGKLCILRAANWYAISLRYLQNFFDFFLTRKSKRLFGFGDIPSSQSFSIQFFHRRQLSLSNGVSPSFFYRGSERFAPPLLSCSSSFSSPRYL